MSLVLFCAPAWPQTVTPGQISDTLKPAPELRAPAAEGRIEAARPPAPRPPGSGATVTVTQFAFTGNTVFSSAELAALVKGYLNRPLNLQQLYEAADRVASHYASRGYALASVNLPPQKITDGRVELQVAEGRVARIDVTGARQYQPGHVRAYLGEFRPNEIYRSDTLQDGLRLLSTLPGLSAKATVKPGTVFGTSDVTVDLDERLLQGDLSVDNYGRKGVGEYRFTARGQINNPLRVEDQLSLTGLLAEDQSTRYWSANYAFPLNFRGTRVRASYADAFFEVKDSPVEGRSRSGDVMLEHPLLLDSRQRLYGTFGATRTLSNADFSGLIFNQTSITLLRLGFTYSHTQLNGSVLQLGTSMSSNFKQLEIEDFANDEVEGKQRLKWEADAQYLLQMTRSFQLYLRVNGAWSPDPLVDTEKYSLGGPGNVRGYPSAEVRGDQGYFASIALQHRLPLGPATLRSRIFFDGGEVFSVDAPDAGSLSSAGVGFDLILRPMVFKLDWAYPLDDRDVSDGRDSGRAFGSLSASF
ncbi:ShlB/FhaC/HecB family hemolysin secretion/activation protein [Fontimonas sp. SYSU GA230001]|uniref:ShlB/FhaC/HecB family hemolysin secretion/activation protein n=1 Tax=Fontimonas sp. SYSU GA230001 TaxID=3142450 RepID=UPI0032B54934